MTASRSSGSRIFIDDSPVGTFLQSTCLAGFSNGQSLYRAPEFTLCTLWAADCYFRFRTETYEPSGVETPLTVAFTGSLPSLASA